MQSESRIEKAGFQSATKNRFLLQLKKHLFNPRVALFFQLDQTVEKPPRFSVEHARRIHESEKPHPCSTAVRVSRTHATTTRTYDTTLHRNIGGAGLAAAAAAAAAARRESA